MTLDELLSHGNQRITLTMTDDSTVTGLLEVEDPFGHPVFSIEGQTIDPANVVSANAPAERHVPRGLDEIETRPLFDHDSPIPTHAVRIPRDADRIEAGVTVLTYGDAENLQYVGRVLTIEPRGALVQFTALDGTPLQSPQPRVIEISNLCALSTLGGSHMLEPGGMAIEQNAAGNVIAYDLIRAPEMDAPSNARESRRQYQWQVRFYGSHGERTGGLTRYVDARGLCTPAAVAAAIVTNAGL